MLKKKTRNPKPVVAQPKIKVINTEESFGFDTDNFDLFDRVETKKTPNKKQKVSKFTNNVLDWVKFTQQGYNFTFDFRIQEEINVKALDAAHQTINKIVQNYPAPYTLFLSGGVDSQAMLYAWHTSGEKFKTCAVMYNFNSNEHDLMSLRQFSKLHNIHINYVNFDLIDFLENMHDEYANKYICGSPQITAYMRMVEMFNSGTAIMSGNFIMPGGATHIGPNQFGLYHFAKLTDTPFIPYFFIETKELAYAFKYNNYARHMSDSNINKVEDIGYAGKVALYQSNGFPVLSQPKKYNGFEKIKEYYDKNTPRVPTIKDKLSTGYAVSIRNFDLLYRNKYEGKFAQYKYNTYTNIEK